MTEQQDTLTTESMPPLMRNPMDPSRVSAYTVLGAVSGLVPLPWVPDAMAKRVRGALIHDIAARHGLTLTADARAILETPWANSKQGFLVQTARFAAGRVFSRLGPLGWVSPVRAAIATYALGHLFSRYLSSMRTLRSSRIDAEEARVFRTAMDKSVTLMITLDAQSPWKDSPRAPEDLRDARTQMVDGMILSLASLPEWAVNRLDSAFDEAMSYVAR